ncbi:MAG: hypothetical protein JWN43_3426 [Gammaproteobacteria bacterium]|nr:hypothetical protein [Gammaproteobacteria bacterium]
MVALTTTISTPTNFVEYYKSINEDDPTRAFVENMVETSDVMRAIPILPAQRGKRSYMDIASLPTVGFRGFNEAANQGLGTFNLREEDTFFIDDYIYADRAMLDRLGPEGKYKQENLKSIALGQFFSQNAIKSDNSANARTPNGIQARCLDGTAATGNLINNSAASGGAALSLQNMDALYWRVNKPTHWIMPRGLMPQWDTAARNNSLVNQTVGYAEDDFGRRIIKFKGLPILFGYEPDDSPDLLPFSEVASGGGGAVTASIYCVSFRPGGFYAIEQTPLSVMPEGPVPGMPFDSTHIKWDYGFAREHPKAIARLTSVTNALIVA